MRRTSYYRAWLIVVAVGVFDHDHSVTVGWGLTRKGAWNHMHARQLDGMIWTPAVRADPSEATT